MHVDSGGSQPNRFKYTLWSPVYDRFARVFDRMRRRSLEVASVQPGERVLLLGAGTGLDLEYLPREARITAIDITPAMIERLKHRARELGMDVDVRVMDGQALAFPDASFDTVVLHLIVAVIPYPVRCLREVERVLRPGGRAVVLDKFVPDDREPTLGQRLLNPVMRFFGTEITRKLGVLMSETGLRMVHEEPLAMNGFYKVAVLCKPDAD